MKLLAIPGTLASPAVSLLRASAPIGAALTVFEGMAGIPPFSPDLDVEPLPAPVAALRALIADADALAICSTQYAGSFPGLLKNVLDWLVSALEVIGKPVLLVTAAETRPAAAHGHLMEVLRTMMGACLIDGGAHELDAAPAALVAGYRALDAACVAAAAASAS